MNPSNMIAARTNPDKTMFLNLAGGEHNRVDEQVKKELTEAGIKAAHGEWLREREVPAAYMGELCMWGFKRAWYYWVATGPGIPPIDAELFHKTWGTQVRVEGHCGCPSPLEYNKGFAVSSYHIDTQEGLNAFAEMLKSIYKEKKDG